MPEFTIVSMNEAKVRTIPGRQGTFINQYADYIQQLPQGQAGKLIIGEGEKHTAIRRRLATTAKAMNIHLIIKRSGNDLYFWREELEAEQPRRGRPRRGRPGDNFPPQPFGAAEEVRLPETGEQEAEATPLDQAFVEVE
jgi:hypothetical protein